VAALRPSLNGRCPADASPPDQGIDPDDPRDAPSASPPGPAPDPDPPSDGGSGGSDDSGGVVERVRTGIDRVASGAGDVVSDTVDAGQNVAEPVTSSVDTVSDTLPGRTGEAFAAGAAVAAVPEPTPVTETTGAAIAGGAALVGGGVLASRALQERGGELGVGERVTNELGVGQQNTDVSEIEPGSGVTSEVGVGQVAPTATEVGLGSVTDVSELDVGGTASDVAINAAQQVGIGEQVGQEDSFTIGRDTIDDVEQTSDIDEQEQLTQIREELERRQEFARENGEQFRDPTRDPVRFPGDEAATGTAPGVIEQQVPDFSGGDATTLGTATGARGATDPFLGGSDFDTGSAGDDVTDPTALANTFGVGTDAGSDTGTGDGTLGGTETGGGTVTDPATGTTTAETTLTATQSATETAQLQASGLASETLTATQTATDTAQAQQSALESQLAEPTLTQVETQVVEPTDFGSPTAQADRDRPRREEPEPDPDDDPAAAVFGIDADAFGSGILSGSDAAASLFDR